MAKKTVLVRYFLVGGVDCPHCDAPHYDRLEEEIVWGESIKQRSLLQCENCMETWYTDWYDATILDERLED